MQEYQKSYSKETTSFQELFLVRKAKGEANQKYQDSIFFQGDKGRNF